MKRLETYILNILSYNDCVIVPDFGSFLTKKESTSLEMGDTSLSIQPSKKKIAFNKLLIDNDGLLENYIRQAENIDIIEAKNYISRQVNYWKQTLSSHKYVEISSIGSIEVNDEGKWIFNREEVNYQSSNYFGLEPIYFILPENKKKANLVSNFLTKKILKLGVLSVLVLTLMILFFSYQQQILLSFKKQPNIDTASILRLDTPDVIQPEKKNKSEIEESVSPVFENSISETSKNQYSIIGGAFRVPENAINFANIMKALGYEGRIIQPSAKTNHLHLVVLSTQTEIDIANIQVNTITQKEQIDAWIFN